MVGKKTSKISKSITGIAISEYLKHDYYQKVVKFIRGRRVLDVGCTEHDVNHANEIRLWNHWLIYNLAEKVTGIDIDAKSLFSMEEMGFDVINMDAENISFKHQFDTIFAGELIEHLKNPGLFLESAAKALKENGHIVLSTPNTYSFARIVRVFQQFTNEPPVNPDHTAYFTPGVISTLVHKCGLRVAKIEYAHFPFTYQSLLIVANKLLCALFGEKFKEQMIVFIAK